MTPPRLARWLLAVATPPADRADILADLDAEYASGVHDDVRRWYWRQVRHSVGPLLARRVNRAMTAPRSVRLDAVSAYRSLRHAPGFALSVISMLALGIGAFLAVFATVDALLLRPLPFGPGSDRLITLHTLHPTAAPDWDDVGMSFPDMLDLRRSASTLTQIEAVAQRDVSFGLDNTVERLAVASVTPGLFDMLSVRPALGRSFTDADAALPGFEAGLIISSALWHSRFGSDTAIVGKTARINGRTLTILGVMPEGFSFPNGQQVWLPFRADETGGRANRGLLVVAKPRPAATTSVMRADLERVSAELAQRYPQTNRDWRTEVVPMRQFFVARRDPMPTLVGVSLVLFVICANVAGLIVARGVSRQRELAVRASLGASRTALIRLMVIETSVLATAGGLGGVLMAAVGLRALIRWSPEPPPYWAVPQIDLRLALFAFALTSLVALIVGVVPAWRVSRLSSKTALTAGVRADTGSRSQRRLQQWLVSSQVAFSAVLLVGAGLTTQSAAALLSADGGFDPAPLLSARFYVAGDRYDDPSARGAAINTVVARVAALPGVIAAGATGAIPTDDGGATSRVQHPAAPGDASREVGVQLTPASPTLWRTLNVSLRDGRAFTAAEASSVESDVVIVSARLAERLWPGRSPVGLTLNVTEPQPRAGHPSGSFAAMRVVGVAPDLVYEEFGEETAQSQLMVYVPTARAPWRTHALLLRTSGDPAALADAVRVAAREVDPDFAVFDMMTMTSRRGFNHWGERFMGQTASTFAAIALVLACVGIYSITTYTVAQRRREIGVRLALGAQPSQVTQVFWRMAGRVVIAGAVVGVGLAVLVARVLQQRLFRTSAWDPTTWLIDAALLASAVAVAAYVPARRASRVDPVASLRSE